MDDVAWERAYVADELAGPAARRYARWAAAGSALGPGATSTNLTTSPRASPADGELLSVRSFDRNWTCEALRGAAPAAAFAPGAGRLLAVAGHVLTAGRHDCARVGALLRCLRPAAVFFLGDESGGPGSGCMLATAAAHVPLVLRQYSTEGPLWNDRDFGEAYAALAAAQHRADAAANRALRRFATGGAGHAQDNDAGGVDGGGANPAERRLMQGATRVNVRVIPAGYHAAAGVAAEPEPLPAAETAAGAVELRPLSWCFIGGSHGGAAAVVAAMHAAALGASVANTSGRVLPAEAAATLRRAALAPTRRGYRHWDTFRHSEAAKSGAVPVCVGLAPADRVAVFGQYLRSSTLVTMEAGRATAAAAKSGTRETKLPWLPRAELLHSALRDPASASSRIAAEGDDEAALPPFVFASSWRSPALQATLRRLTTDAAAQATQRAAVRAWYRAAVDAARGALAWALATETFSFPAVTPERV